jgi:hypothetical protein
MTDNPSEARQPQQTSLPSIVSGRLNPAFEELTARAVPLLDQVASGLFGLVRVADAAIARRPRLRPAAPVLGGEPIEFLEDWW